MIPGRLLGSDWGEKSALAALVIDLVNLLPVYPLDGGRIALSLTGSKKLVKICGIISAGVILVSGVILRRYEILFPAILLFSSAVRSK